MVLIHGRIPPPSGESGSTRIQFYDRRRRNSYGFGVLETTFAPTKWAPQAIFFQFQGATKGILRYKMSAAGKQIALSGRY